MEIFEWVASGGILGLVGIMWKAARDNDAKVNRLYRRLDEVKESQEKNFTRRDVCEVLHKQISADLTEIKLDLKTILRHNGYNK